MSKPQFTEKCSTDRNNSDDYVNDHSFHMTISKKKMFPMNQLYRAPSSFPGPFGGVGKRPWERG